MIGPRPLLHRISGIAVALLVSAPLAGARADVSGAQRAEVDHLLEFVRTSRCAIDRNGAIHDGPAAHAHIIKKYDYFRAEIRTTEDFIASSATRSTLSGRAYTVTCPGQPPQPTGEWLLEELRRYRAAHAAPPR